MEFLEFAVDEESGERLGKVLEQFSFTKTGQHKSKAVTLYQQGDINLILNAEPDSFAHAFFVAHGYRCVPLHLRLVKHRLRLKGRRNMAVNRLKAASVRRAPHSCGAGTRWQFAIFR